jgi:hypothetical protein
MKGRDVMGLEDTGVLLGEFGYMTILMQNKLGAVPDYSNTKHQNLIQISFQNC